MNYGYPKIHFWMSKKKFWVSINREPYRAPDVSASRRFGTKPLNTPRRFDTKTFRHQNISTQDGWMDGWMDGIKYMCFNYMYYVRMFRSI